MTTQKVDWADAVQEAHRVEPFLPEFNGDLAPLFEDVRFLSRDEGRDVSKILLDAENLLKGVHQVAEFRENGIEVKEVSDALTDLLTLFKDVQHRCSTYFEGRVQQIRAHASVSAMRANPHEGDPLDITSRYRLVSAKPSGKESQQLSKVVDTGFSSNTETGAIVGRICYYQAEEQEDAAPKGSVILPEGMSFEIKKGEIINLHTRGTSSHEGRLVAETKNTTLIVQAVDETVKIIGPAVWSSSALEVDLIRFSMHKRFLDRAERFMSRVGPVVELHTSILLLAMSIALIPLWYFGKIKGDTYVEFAFGALITVLLFFSGCCYFCSANKRKQTNRLRIILAERTDKIRRSIFITNENEAIPQEIELLKRKNDFTSITVDFFDTWEVNSQSLNNLFYMSSFLNFLPARLALSAGGRALPIMEPILSIEDRSGLLDQSRSSSKR